MSPPQCPINYFEETSLAPFWSQTTQSLDELKRTFELNKNEEFPLTPFEMSIFDKDKEEFNCFVSFTIKMGSGNH